jgi:putative flippase GtrA
MRDLARRLLADEKVRFLIIGGINIVVGYAVFGALTLWVFHDVRFGYLLSLLGGYAVAIALAFVQYRRFVFVVQGNVLKTFSFKRDGAPRGR